MDKGLRVKQRKYLSAVKRQFWKTNEILKHCLIISLVLLVVCMYH
jgi:hypothetical protein